MSIAISIECSCGGSYSLGKDDGRKGSCPRCGTPPPLPELGLDQTLLQITPQIWKVLCRCQQKLKLPRKMAGHRFQCPKCKKIGRVPRQPQPAGREAMNDATLITEGNDGPPPPRTSPANGGLGARMGSDLSTLQGSGTQNRAPGGENGFVVPPKSSFGDQDSGHGEARGGLGPLAPDLEEAPLLEMAPGEGAGHLEALGGLGPMAPDPDEAPLLQEAPTGRDQIDMSLPEIILPPTLSFGSDAAGEQGAAAAVNANTGAAGFDPIPLEPAAPASGFSFDGPWEEATDAAQGAAPELSADCSESGILAPPMSGYLGAGDGLPAGEVNVSAIQLPPPGPADGAASPAMPQDGFPFPAGHSGGPGSVDSAFPAPQGEPAFESASKTCPGCKNSLPEAAVLCVNCGFDLRSNCVAHAPAGQPDPRIAAGLHAADLVSYFNITGGVEAAKAGITQVLNGMWLYVPLALISAIMWQVGAILMAKDWAAGLVFAAVLQPLVGTILFAGLIACVRDGVFQLEFGIERLLYNCARYWPSFVLGVLLNVPFWALAGVAGVALAKVIGSETLGLSAKIALAIPLGLGGVIWIGLLGLLLPVATVIEGGSPVKLFDHVLRFGLTQAHKLFALGVCIMLIGGGSVAFVGFLYINVGPSLVAVMPFALFAALSLIAVSIISFGYLGEIIASLSLLYLSSIEDNSRLIAMRDRPAGPELNPVLTKASLAVLLALTVGLSFLLTPSSMAQALLHNVSATGYEEGTFDDGEIEADVRSAGAERSTENAVVETVDQEPAVSRGSAPSTPPSVAPTSAAPSTPPGRSSTSTAPSTPPTRD